MPRPGQTPPPAFETGTQLPKGAATDIAALEQAIPGLSQEPIAPEDQFQPKTPLENFLFGPTDRPEEPLTHGAPFGPGADYTPAAHESDADFMRRVATSLAQDTDPEVRAFAAQVENGL